MRGHARLGGQGCGKSDTGRGGSASTGRRRGARWRSRVATSGRVESGWAASPAPRGAFSRGSAGGLGGAAVGSGPAPQPGAQARDPVRAVRAGPLGATSPGSRSRDLPKSVPQARWVPPVPGGSVRGEAVRDGDDSPRIVRVGSLDITLSNAPANAGSLGADDPGTCPGGSGTSPERDVPNERGKLHTIAGHSALPSSV